jgi:UTP:GlnB (protein PII) uridylyltransferase
MLTVSSEVQSAREGESTGRRGDAGALRLASTMLADGNYKLQFLFPTDASGILYKVTTVLFAYGWDILSAYSRPNEEAEVEDIFIVTSTRHEALSKSACDTILSAVRELISGETTPDNFISRFPERVQQLKNARAIRSDFVFEPYPKKHCSRLVVERPDRPGVLMQITQVLYTIGLDIISFSAEAVVQGVRDEFLINHADGTAISEKDRAFLSDLFNQKLTF